MNDMILSRARLRRDVPAAALAALLAPTDKNAQVGASHNVLWSLYSDGPDRQRDFLFRQTSPGEWITLGPRSPVDQHNLFDLDCKPFAPEFQIGDQLAFTLRVNATVCRVTKDGRSVRHDVVMNASSNMSREQRASARADVMQSEAKAWLDRQGATNGFALSGVTVDGYDRVRTPRPRGPGAVFGVLDLSGALEVTDPVTFLAKLGQGFGRARAFGCGLMLVRRVS